MHVYACVRSCVRACGRACVRACIHVLLKQRDRAVKASLDQSTLVLQLTTERDQLEVQIRHCQQLLASAKAEVGDNVLSKIWYLKTQSQC